MNARLTFRFYLTVTSIFILMGQSLAQVTIQGHIYDASTSLPLPYATIAETASLLGTTSDAHGQFELVLLEITTTDSILISYIGYKSELIPALDFHSTMEIGLEPSAKVLDAVVVRPLSASEYLSLIERKIERNTAQYSFNTFSRYEEKVTEDSRTIGHNAGIFKSWHSAYRTGAENYHQLALYKQEEIVDLEFMQKKAEKKKKNYLKKNPDQAEQFEEGQLFINNFGGPMTIQTLNLYAKSLLILDSTEHKNFDLKYLPESEYLGRKLTVIQFNSKGKLDDRKFSGTVYIDQISDAVVQIKEKGELIIPLLIRPILFALGIEINSVEYTMNLKMRLIGEQWYPQYTHWDARVDVKKKHLFQKNEKAIFLIKQELEITDIITEGVQTIPESDRFDGKEKMSKQIRPISGVNW